MERKLLSERFDYQIFGAEGVCKHIVEKINEIAPGSLVFDANWILGKEHIVLALFHASRAFARRTHKIYTFENCVLLYVGLSHQIYEARRNVGVKPDTRKFAFVVPTKIKKSDFLAHLNLRENESVIAFSETKARKIFTSGELEATPKSHWPHLVFERMALLNIL